MLILHETNSRVPSNGQRTKTHVPLGTVISCPRWPPRSLGLDFTPCHKKAPPNGRDCRNFVSFEAISESVPRGVLVSGIGQMVGERKPFSGGEILLGLSPGGVIAMLRRSRLRLSDWKWEFHIHFNSYPQGR